MPSSRTRRGMVAASALVLALVALGGCSSDSEPETTVEATTTTTAPAGQSTDSGSKPGSTPPWAKPFQTPGQKITTVDGGTFKVDVYQVGVAKAPKNGSFVDPDTNKPIIAQGDDIVFVNYVLTNTSNAAILLPISLVKVTPKYADWRYLQGMDSISDRALFEQMKVVDSALAPGNTKAPLSWDAGTSFSFGTNFKYQPGSAITFTATLTPANAEGGLVHDQRKEVSQETKIS